METIEIEDLRKRVSFQTLRGSGPGGQHRNKVETTVRATHLPTGLTVVVSDHRSQLLNKELALNRLRERLMARLKKKKPRIGTKPSRGAREKRLEQKHHLAQKKQWRRNAHSD
ncbi:MAG: peptide chain release factor-like protein [bacterium]|jgi:ribosome-associated protein|nr:peptide chain release factor-like protein [bacterium]